MLFMFPKQLSKYTLRFADGPFFGTHGLYAAGVRQIAVVIAVVNDFVQGSLDPVIVALITVDIDVGSFDVAVIMRAWDINEPEPQLRI